MRFLCKQYHMSTTGSGIFRHAADTALYIMKKNTHKIVKNGQEIAIAPGLRGLLRQMPAMSIPAKR